jgi:hypothetical protein
MIASIKRRVAVLSIALLGGGVLLLAAKESASAASLGLQASCSPPSASRTVWTCDFPVLSSEFNADIIFYAVECSGSKSSAYYIQLVEIDVILPNGTSAIGYSVAGFDSSLDGVDHAAGDVNIYVKINTKPSAVIDIFPNTEVPTQCTVSLTATY